MNMLGLTNRRVVTTDEAAALRAADPASLQPLVPTEVRMAIGLALPVRVAVGRENVEEIATFSVVVESLECTRDD